MNICRTMKISPIYALIQAVNLINLILVVLILRVVLVELKIFKECLIWMNL